MRRWPLFFSAALFAVHPVHVETVSWLQGGKVTLMGMFFLLSLLSYFRFRSGGGGRYYWFCLASFVASLLSQPAAVSLPLVLAGWELAGRPGLDSKGADNRTSGVVLRLLPFFLPALLLAAQLLFFSSVRIGAGTNVDAPLASRLAFLPVVLGKSLLKLLIPVNLCARYPLDVPADINYTASAGWLIFCFAAGWVLFRMTGQKAAGLFLLTMFLATSLPTSGLVETSTLMADRYLYLPGMALCLVAGYGTARLRRGNLRPVAALLLLTLVSLACVSLARQADWRSRVSLWSRIIEVYPEHALGQFNLADAWSSLGETDKAIKRYYRALEINPQYGDAYANLSTLVLGQGRTALARQLIARAVELRPDRSEVWIKHGLIMASSGDDSLAEASFRRAIEIGDHWAWAGHLNLGMLYAGRGENSRAREEIQLSLEAAKESGRTNEVINLVSSALARIQETSGDK